ncbi:hypothetical protein MA16_Dca029046 [Dendrobium catenatum]|uniref:Uncharacterized protein n=1 Tax=Dendrobium catenatum TaxID=906689 RepID=A0A2I0VEJ4_9ASPA|nr:hypothetical protein MA16_Dca029046 [Dendrobium catenatum]
MCVGSKAPRAQGLDVSCSREWGSERGRPGATVQLKRRIPQADVRGSAGRGRPRQSTRHVIGSRVRRARGLHGRRCVGACKARGRGAMCNAWATWA